MIASPILMDGWIAARRLAKTPAYTLLLLATLALGIGAHAAIDRIAEVVLFPEQSFTDSSRVVSVELYRRGAYVPLLESHVARLVSQGQWFEHVESIRTSQLIWRQGHAARRLSAAYVTPVLPSRMGVAPVLGRGLLADDGSPGHEPVVVVSETMWRRDFAAAADVIGRTIVLDEVSRTVVGVVKPSAAYARVDVWLPTGTEQAGTQRVTAFAWLRPHLASKPETAGLTGSSVGFDGPDADLEVRLIAATRRTGGSAARTLIFLETASWCLLAIICANFAMLLLIRNLSRQRELSTCAALGASFARILRPLSWEALLLGVGGGALGVLVADWCIRALLWLRPRSLSLLYPERIPLDLRLVVSTMAVSLVIAMMLAALSTVRVRRSDLLRGAGRSDGAPLQHGVRRLLGGAVILETALAVVLVAGASVILASFLRLRGGDPGFEPEQVAELGVELDAARFTDPAARRNLWLDVAARVSRVAGVVETTVTSDAPPHSVVISGEMDRLTSGVAAAIEASWVFVAPNYFRVLRIPVRSGRTFSESDGKGTVILSESLASRYWGTAARAVGEPFTLRRPNGAQTTYEIVGVVGDIFGRGLRDQYDEIYLPYAAYSGARGSVLARTTGDAVHLLPMMRAQLWAVDPDVPESDIGTLSAAMAASIDDQPFYLALFGFFATVAMVLATLGVAGVAAYVSAARRDECAVHLALGARRSDIERMVISQGLAASFVGTGLGLVGAVLLSDSIRVVVRDVGAISPSTYAAIALAVGLLSVCASWLPARRASRADPASLLRRSR